ncbi:MAG TPA: PilT/PilU family type 4a pilus ATPase [Candidatus Pacearchaeota archaeon]|mgnify:FL=1|jgi:twitching motility protein PilT|nr:PilT/PilU family type 4a pilus ATPase [Candidatus Pacearchaeota archaeon]HQG09278.1 PilT/PilU family type 4a pilus ATPase [Candidatus Pacearchaeota archaeon]HQH20408.1 PilT/PilU family type 4a pilus ATPase [Candidatus Pacearchaeota archaeon]HQK58347.1 PilT/PilU family type 4a pilus ATPase [Candidatus Pacearchaeota archaeon]
MEYFNYLQQLLYLAIEKKASDVHIIAGHPPIFRINRNLMSLPKDKTLLAEDAAGICFTLTNEAQKEKLLIEKEVDFSYNLEGIGRFRVNIYYQLGTLAAALRAVPSSVRGIDSLGLPMQIYRFTKALQGFVLITGPASHGKSTTLAAIIDEINKTRACNIITIEDPIEYVFKDDKSVISQREMNSDTLSFARALKSTFREDPDVIMVGEMRDPETIATAITAAETGHLVFATLHTNSAAQTINRIVDAFGGEQQNQIRAQLSSSLLGIVSQRLIPAIDGGVVPACEIMFNTPAVANLIRENKIHELSLVIDTSSDMGMISLNRSLAELVRKQLVSVENALNYSSNIKELKKLISQ